MVWITVFIANAAVLVLEIVGARALTPFFGSSAESWAGFIGIVLLGLALGYWGGGRIADRMNDPVANRRLLSGVTAGAGLCIIATWSGADAIAALASLLTGVAGLTVAASSAALILFFVPSALLAAVSPIAVKALLKDLDSSATLVGRISAVAAAGSVLGSLGVGIALVPYIGSFTTLIGMGVVLIGIGFVISLRAESTGIVVACIAAALIASVANITLAPAAGAYVEGELVADRDTRYNRIFVVDKKLGEHGPLARLVYTDPFGVQCGAIMAGGSEPPLDLLPFPYTRAFDAVFEIVPAPSRMLVIGGCNYSYPLHASRRSPETQIDVVELDSGMTQVAREWFNLEPETFATSIHTDGRYFLHTGAESDAYDVVVIDAYNSVLSTPFQLLTVEAYAELKRALKPEGVVVFNIIGSVDGVGSEYVSSVLNTLLEVFPTVAVYQIGIADRAEIQNLLVLASETVEMPNHPLALSAQNLTLYPVSLTEYDSSALVLTDDYAPIERLTKPLRDRVLYR